MKSSTRLDSALFQLTPTRTRCELVVSANGKTEKIASGLLNPFLAHLKAARDQMAKGGYSIVLEPEHGSKPSWFTRGTLERFVRFVSTPEVLERVYTLESEILQIEEAISIQSNKEISIHPVENHHEKSADVVEVSCGKSLLDHNDSRAIVLYKPDAQPDANGSAEKAVNSKVQLLKVLETRKAVLQKEQGMAFARAVAAGFDIDVMTPLMSFAECFGASRLRDACTKFTELWKRKHETGQWLEIEAEAIASQLDYSHVNATGIILSDVPNKTKEGLRESPNDLVSEDNAKATAAVNPDEKPPRNQQVPSEQHEYFQGHPYMFPAWPMHSPPGAPIGFQPYPMQAIPYFPNNPGNSPYFQQQPYPPVEYPRVYSGQKVHRRGHSSERRGELVSPDMDDNLTRSSDECQSDDGVESRKKGSRSRKKQSGKVVIRNINYITPTKQNFSDGESSQSQTDGDDVEVGTAKKQHGHSNRSSDRKSSIGSKKEEASHGNEADGGHWQAFQSYLLKEVDEERQNADGGMFSMEKEVWLKRRKDVISDDPLTSGRDMDKRSVGLSRDMQDLSGNATYMRRMSNDGSMIFLKDGGHGDGRNSTGGLDLHSTENGRRSEYRGIETDDFIICNQEKTLIGSASDILALNRYEGAAGGVGTRSSQNITDDSYIVSLRSACVDEVENSYREAMDIHSEFPSKSNQGGDDSSRKIILNYEPDDLSMMPERRTEGQSNGYNPALECEMQIQRKAVGSLDKDGKEAVTDPKQRTKTQRDPKQALSQDALRKKNVGPIRKGKPSKLNPLDEARARAEKLRSYKADLQKMKKEQEEEQAKRLEALKLERQKRIASKSSTNPTQSTVVSQQGRRQLPMKISPSSHRGSKFSDLEPGSSSPLQRFHVRNASGGSSKSQRASKLSRLSAGGNSAENRLTRSASSLPEAKKQNGGGVAGPERKTSMTKIRRLSEPKSVSSTVTSLVKHRVELVRPKISADETTSKKISAIVNLDKSKAATLPELKIRASKAPNAAGSMTVMEPELMGDNAEMKCNNDGTSHIIDQDENPIVEKTVVMLEEKPTITKAHASDEKHQPQKLHNERGERREVGRPVCTSLSPPVLNQVDKKPKQVKVQDVGTKELVARNEVLAQSSRTSNSDKSYQAPYARVSSLEDPCTNNSGYAKALPTCSDVKVAESEPVKAHVSDSKNVGPEKIPSEIERQQKESAKGFKRLLKFGRKNNNSTASDHDCDEVSIGGSEANDGSSKPASSAEVHTLKTLISQDETPTAASTPKKASRTFSLLSPFRSKNSEKKQAAA